MLKSLSKKKFRPTEPSIKPKFDSSVYFYYFILPQTLLTCIVWRHMFNWRISTNLPRCFNLLWSMPATYVHLPYFWVTAERIPKPVQIQSGIQSHLNFNAANIECSLTLDKTSWQKLSWWTVETHASHLEGSLYNISCRFYNRQQLVTLEKCLCNTA